MNGYREILDAYDTVSQAMDQLTTLVTGLNATHAGTPDAVPSPVELLSQAASRVLQDHGCGDPKAFPLSAPTEVMRITPTGPIYVDVSHRTRLVQQATT